ncbi:MAG: rRNA methyltransferase [Candidatus Omnitrophica bacterium]|nr:rRNA methyltransferase [Candidatus Omnitrophota bacterium]
MTAQILITCKTDYEKILAREIASYNFTPQTKGRGWILAQLENKTLFKEHRTQLTIPCFAHSIRETPIAVSAASVNSLADQLVNLFLTNLGSKRIADPWAFLFSSSGNEQLIHRAKSAEKSWLNKLQKKISRVAKLAREGIPYNSSFVEGFFVHFIDFNQAFVSFKALSAGQQRMQMDPKAPSRSYLKLEEAFKIFGNEPRRNEKVIDLGAAPGGWSYSALKRGAIVIAIDNGPLKSPVKLHSNMSHLKVDALKYTYDSSKPVDWLFCDILEKPDIIFNLLHKWLSQKWCRNFIANIKVGRNDPIVLLNKINNSRDGLLPFCQALYIRQLYHDREEITLMGQAK